MRVLVTRPQPDAETTAAELRRRGHDPMLAPMLATRFSPWRPAQDHPLPDAVIATSVNGIRGLDACPWRTALLALPLFVPGEASAAFARTAGFCDVRPVFGDSTQVADRVLADLPPGTRLLYAAGVDRTGALDDRLRERGYAVDLVEVYQAAPAERLSDDVGRAFLAGDIDAILVFSARTATALVACLMASDLLPLSSTIAIHAISHQAARPLKDAGFRAIIVAPRPDAAELLDTLEMGRSSASSDMRPEGDAHGSQ
jgi:uroporphyrinogen-III synthase